MKARTLIDAYEVFCPLSLDGRGCAWVTNW